MTLKYQLLHPLRREEYVALRADIERRGVMVPVEEDENGQILDGHHRAQIAEDLGIECPRIVRRFKDEHAKREHVIKINLARRHLDALRWGQAFALLLEERGVRRVRGPKPAGAISLTVREIAKELGVPIATAERRLAQADVFETLPVEHQKAVLDGTTRLKKAIKEHRRAQRKAAAREATLPGSVELTVEPMETLLGRVRHVDAIITDPPYGRDAVLMYGGLVARAKDALKPGGVLAVMCGQSYLPDLFTVMYDALLPYRWTMAFLTPGGQSAQLWERRVNTFWKPVLVFGRVNEDTAWLGDVVRSATNDNDKRFHDWGQSESGMRQLIEALTQPGDLVCDPFCGGGTTAVVAHRLGRRFIGCDVDAEAVTLTRGRFA